MPFKSSIFRISLILHLISPTFYNAQRKHLAAQLRLHIIQTSRTRYRSSNNSCSGQLAIGTKRAEKNLRTIRGNRLCDPAYGLLWPVVFSSVLAVLVAFEEVYAHGNTRSCKSRSRKKNNAASSVVIIIIIHIKTPLQQQILKRSPEEWNRRFAY